MPTALLAEGENHPKAHGVVAVGEERPRTLGGTKSPLNLGQGVQTIMGEVAEWKAEES